MFGIDSSELAIIALVALLVIGPKDLPKALRWAGQYVGKARAMTRHLRAGFDTMMRESELEEMQKLWAAQNEAIMKASTLPENSLPDLAGPVPIDPWDEGLPDPVIPAAEPAAEPVAPARKPRKPRAKKPVEPALPADAAGTGDAA
jgi:sec-independent protein translocase protein TatB